MKNVKKIVLAASLCAAMAATAAFGTLAYFTDTKEATNTFTAGDLSITLDEPDWDEANGTNVVPGREIAKNPGITVNKDSVASYVRAVVEMPKEIYDASDFYRYNETALVSFLGQNDAFTVNEDASDFESPTVKVVLDFGVAASTYDADADLGDLFTSVKFSEKIGNQEGDLGVELLDEEFNIKVTAYATQAEGFTSADEAFAASFEDVFGE